MRLGVPATIHFTFVPVALTSYTLTQHFYYIFKYACVFRASSHSIRRTFFTNLAQGGISVFVLARLAEQKNHCHTALCCSE
jgi:hypothetical protein